MHNIKGVRISDFYMPDSLSPQAASNCPTSTYFVHISRTVSFLNEGVCMIGPGFASTSLSFLRSITIHLARTNVRHVHKMESWPTFLMAGKCGYNLFIIFQRSSLVHAVFFLDHETLHNVPYNYVIYTGNKYLYTYI